MSRFARLAIAGLIFATLILLATHPLPEKFYSPTSDEGYYVQYAQTVQEQGPKGFRDLIDWYSQSPEARFHPAPTRIGYITLTALVFNFTGAQFPVLGAVSLVSFLLFILVFFQFSRKYFGIDVAFIATLFLSSSPLLLTMSRRALTDSTTNLFWALSVWYFLDYLISKTKVQGLLFVAAFAGALLVKESSVILIPFFVLMAWLDSNPVTDFNRFSKSIEAILSATIVATLIYIVVLGGWEYFLKAISAILATHTEAHQTNHYALYSTGPWFRYLVDFMLLTPIVTLLFLGYSFHAIASRKTDRYISYFLIYFTVTYGILNCVSHGKVIRFAINLEMVLGLFAALAILELFKTGTPQQRSARTFSATILVFVFNISSFIQLFYLTGLLDPISYNLFIVRNFFPAK